MSRISNAQEDPGRRTLPRIDLSPTPRSETVLPMLQWRPGGFDNNEVLEAYPSLFKPSGTDSMLLGSSPVFLLRSPVFFQRHWAARLQFARNHVRWNRQRWRTVTFSDESRFLFSTHWRAATCLESERGTSRRSTCSHAKLIMEEASWSGQVWRRTGAPTSLLFQEYWPDNATSTSSYVLMWCLSYAQWATMASSKMTTQGRIGQELISAS